MKPCDVVDEAFFQTAKARGSAERTMAVSASQLFTALEDGPSWRKWMPVIRAVQWTSPKPYCVGTTRTVTLVGGVQLEERFWAWEQDRHMGFYVTASSNALVRTLIESYEITPLAEQRCSLRWRMGIALRGSLSFIEPYMRPSLGKALSPLMARLERVAATFPNKPTESRSNAA